MKARLKTWWRRFREGGESLAEQRGSGGGLLPFLVCSFALHLGLFFVLSLPRYAPASFPRRLMTRPALKQPHLLTRPEITFIFKAPSSSLSSPPVSAVGQAEKIRAASVDGVPTVGSSVAPPAGRKRRLVAHQQASGEITAKRRCPAAPPAVPPFLKGMRGKGQIPPPFPDAIASTETAALMEETKAAFGFFALPDEPSFAEMLLQAAGEVEPEKNLAAKGAKEESLAKSASAEAVLQAREGKERVAMATEAEEETSFVSVIPSMAPEKAKIAGVPALSRFLASSFLFLPGLETLPPGPASAPGVKNMGKAAAMGGTVALSSLPPAAFGQGGGNAPPFRPIAGGVGARDEAEAAGAGLDGKAERQGTGGQGPIGTEEAGKKGSADGTAPVTSGASEHARGFASGPALAPAGGGPAGEAIGSNSPAVCLEQPSILYPSLERRKGIEGKVILRVEVLPDGRTGRVELVESSRRRGFDQTALEALRKFKWQPACRDGKPVTSWREVKIVFSLSAPEGKVSY